METRKPFLDWVRAGSAAIICVGTTRAHLIQDFQDVKGVPEFSVWSNYFFLGFETQALWLLICLSGFLVGGNELRKALNGKFSWKHYFLARATRVTVPVVPLLALYLVASTFLGMGSELFTLLPAIVSLLWCYLLFGLGAQALQVRKNFKSFGVSFSLFIIALGCSLTFGAPLFWVAALWSVGLVARVITDHFPVKTKAARVRLAASSALLLGVSLFFSRMNELADWSSKGGRFAVVAMAMGLFLYACSQVRIRNRAGVRRFLTTFSQFSFSLIIVQALFGQFLVEFLSGGQKLPMSPQNVLMLWGAVGTLVSVSYVLYHAFEVRTQAIRTTLSSRWLPSKRARPVPRKMAA